MRKSQGEANAGWSSPDRAWLIVAVLFTIACNVGNIFFLPGFSDFEHEGILLKPAADWLDGRMLYRDVFSQYGPVSIVCQAFAMKLGGPYVFAVKAQLVIVCAITSVFLFSIWSRLFSAPVACASVGLWNLLSYHFVHPAHPWSSSFALCFQAMSMFCLLEGLARSSLPQLLLAGIAGGLTVFSKQNIGGYLLVAEAIGVAWYGLGLKTGMRTIVRNIAILAGGSIAVAATAFIWLASNDALWPWFEQNVIWPPAFAKMMGSSNPVLILQRLFLIDTPFASWPGATAGQIFVLIPLTAIAVAAWGVVGRATAFVPRPSDLLVVFAFTGLASWLQYYPVNGLAQVWWGASPLVGLFVGCLHVTIQAVGSNFQFSQRTSALATAAAIAAWCSHEIYWRGVYIDNALTGRLVRVTGGGPISGLLVHPELNEFIHAVEGAIDREIVAKGKRDVLLFGINGFYLFMIKGHVPFHPHWYLGDQGVIRVLYPELPGLVDEHIKKKRPPVIIDTVPMLEAFLNTYPDYKVVAGFQEPVKGWVFALLVPAGEPSDSQADQKQADKEEREGPLSREQP